MRFLHTSDWHLGRTFFGRSLVEDQNYVLNQILEIVRKTKLDAILIAGDIYDRSVPPTDAVEALDYFVSEAVLSHRVPVVLIPGNHDSPERIAFGSKLLSGGNLHVFKSFGPNNVVSFSDDGGPID